jgi:hypothetical protein
MSNTRPTRYSDEFIAFAIPAGMRLNRSDAVKGVSYIIGSSRKGAQILLRAAHDFGETLSLLSLRVQSDIASRVPGLATTYVTEVQSAGRTWHFVHSQFWQGHKVFSSRASFVGLCAGVTVWVEVYCSGACDVSVWMKWLATIQTTGRVAGTEGQSCSEPTRAAAKKRSCRRKPSPGGQLPTSLSYLPPAVDEALALRPDGESVALPEMLALGQVIHQRYGALSPEAQRERIGHDREQLLEWIKQNRPERGAAASVVIGC